MAETLLGLNEFGYGDIALMTGERIDSALRLSAKDSEGENGAGVMLLTDRRIIHLQGNGKRRKATFASINDVDAIEISSEQQSRSAYVWAGLAFLVAILLFVVISNSTGRIAAAVVVGLMGVYLIADQLLSPGRQYITFRAGSSQLRCDLGGDVPSSEIYGFINRVFQLKGFGGSDGYSRPGRFAPH